MKDILFWTNVLQNNIDVQFTCISIFIGNSKKKERHFVLYSSTYIRVIKIIFQQLITRFKNKVSPLRVGRGLFFKDV